MSRLSSDVFQKSKTTEHYKQLVEYREKLSHEAEQIVLYKFPKKVAEFNAFLNGPRFSYDRLPEIMPNLEEITPLPVDEITKKRESSENSNQPNAKRAKTADGKPSATTSITTTSTQSISSSSSSHSEKHHHNKPMIPSTTAFGTPVYGFLHGTVPGNAKLGELMDEIRPLLREAVEDVNKIKIWIQFLIPRIEDGNNFGVSIQEDCLSEVRNVEAEAASFLDQMSRYFISRAQLITKIAKYPHVDDYRRAVLDTDEKQFLNVRLVIMEMRNHFATLHDVLTKNYDKIKKPRSNNAEMMY